MRARKRGLSRKDKLGLVIIVASVAVVVALIAVRLVLTERRDPETYCLRDQVSPRQTVILLDHTDPVPQRYLTWFGEALQRMKDRMAVNDRLVAYTASNSRETIAEEVLALCFPGSREDANPLFQNPRRFDERFAEFEAQLQETLQERPWNESAPQSLILESLRDVAMLERFAETPEVQRHLIIVSDLLQHSEALNQYESTSADFEAFRRMPAYETLRPELRGVEVTVLYVQRDTERQGPAHRRFWDALLRDAGASRVRFID